MAIRDDREAGHIYDLHNHWIREVLANGGSLLNDAAVWTEETIDEVIDCFIGQPDSTPGKSFRDKLRDQMEGATPEALQLIAELHIIHFLHVWKGAILPRTKLAQVEMVLSWGPHPPSVPTNVVEALGPGLIHPGQYALSRRDVQLTWIIQFAKAWIGLPIEEREVKLVDPWAFRSYAMAIGTDSAVNAQIAMVHMTHPETFESIVAVRHKQSIAQRRP